MPSVSLVASTLLYAAFAHAHAYAYGTTTKTILPFQLVNGTSFAEEISIRGGLDLPKMKPTVNDTTFDWWYFDAVSTSSQNESITFVYYNYGPNTLDIPYGGGPVAIQVSGTFDNGTVFREFAFAQEGAVIETSPAGISADFKGSGGSFVGSSLERPKPKYTVMFDNAAVGISGKLTLESVSPPHYPCHINKPGVSEEIIPDVFWSNAIPDAVATADFIIRGKLLSFTGNGYHDKNWGTKPLREVMKSWYWGHGRVGPYSIVWFDTLTPDGKEHFSSWITKNGKVVSQSCQQESIVVRPWGENSDYPPPPILPPPSGYSLRYDMAQGQTFVANFTSETIALATDTYKRMVGPIVGGIEGDKQYEGRALCEQFQF